MCRNVSTENRPAGRLHFPVLPTLNKALRIFSKRKRQTAKKREAADAKEPLGKDNSAGTAFVIKGPPASDEATDASA